MLFSRHNRASRACSNRPVGEGGDGGKARNGRGGSGGVSRTASGLEREVLDGMICSISNALMTDPVCCVDGHTYERSAIAAWLAEGHITSPSTGLPMHSTAIIPNHNLRRSIEDLLRRSPALVYLQTSFEAPKTTHQYHQPTQYAIRRFCVQSKCKGGSVELSEANTVATRTSSSPQLTEAIVFVEENLRTVAEDQPGVSVEIVSTVTSFNGLVIGLTDRDPMTWNRGNEDLVNNYSWYISDSGYLVYCLSLLLLLPVSPVFCAACVVCGCCVCLCVCLCVCVLCTQSMRGDDLLT
eukprot:GHVQ01029611.1.p1 GENE.GHVQ01029611.1~~GHVQ01029611.1.p1  ORF type:complete len:296 (-),score=52.43 GHVQ01029611.1:514-1401(-)